MIENKHYLYRHIRLDTNEVFYVGIGTKYKPFSSYKTEYTRAYITKEGRSTFWKRITSKTEYRVEIMFESNDYDFIKEKEREFIKLYGRRDLGEGTLVNMTDGGEGHKNFSKELIKRFSINCSLAKLNPEKVKEIIKIAKENPNMSNKAIGSLFGVSHCSVQAIRNGKSWKFLTEEVDFNKKPNHLTSEQITQIKDLIEKGLSLRNIAKELKISRVTITKVKNNEYIYI